MGAWWFGLGRGGGVRVCGCRGVVVVFGAWWSDAVRWRRCDGLGRGWGVEIVVVGLALWWL